MILNERHRSRQYLLRDLSWQLKRYLVWEDFPQESWLRSYLSHIDIAQEIWHIDVIINTDSEQYISLGARDFSLEKSLNHDMNSHERSTDRSQSDQRKGLVIDLCLSPAWSRPKQIVRKSQVQKRTSYERFANPTATKPTGESGQVRVVDPQSYLLPDPDLKSLNC